MLAKRFKTESSVVLKTVANATADTPKMRG